MAIGRLSDASSTPTVAMHIDSCPNHCRLRSIATFAALSVSLIVELRPPLAHGSLSAPLTAASGTRSAWSSSDELVQPSSVCIASKRFCVATAQALAPSSTHSADVLSPVMPAAWQRKAARSSIFAIVEHAASKKHHGWYTPSTTCADDVCEQLAAFSR